MSEYFARLKLDGELATIVNRYYGRTEDAEFAGGPGFMQHLQSRLPLYKQWFVEAAEQSSQDWRLLAAMGYQESKWNPSAASSAGARGLMQLTVETANETRVTDLSDARQSIFGGARYFRQVYEKIPSHVPEPDRTWFALAAYNIGYGHVEDARVLAQKAGRDPDSWQDVRDFLPLLEQARWYTKTENGYARGWEPVRYVDNVRGYRDLLEWAWGAGPRAAVVELAPTFEELPQQQRGFLAADTAENIHALRQPRLSRQIDHAAASARFCIPSAEHDASDARVEHGPHAHGARLERHVQRRIAQPVVAQCRRARTQSDDFRMSGRVAARDGSIPPLADDFIVRHQQSPDRHFALFGSALCEQQRAAHPFSIGGGLHDGAAVRHRRPT